ncbi:MAG: T9SS type A sorting domain-containing protein, partial [Bacteroidota bacterium]
MKLLHLLLILFFLLPCMAPSTLIAQCSTISIASQAQVDDFKNSQNNCTVIQGNLNIGGAGSDITNLNGLNEVVEVTGQFNISGAAQLQNFEGMDTLTTIGGNLRVWDNPQLVNFEGLENVNSIGGVLSVRNNVSLQDFTGLESVTTLGRLFIDDNEFLRTMKGLSGLTSIQNIPNVPEADGGVVITDNFSLEHFRALSGIQSIAGPLNVINNSFVVSLEGLENIDHQTINGLIIGGNILLDSCRFANICAYLAEEIGPYNIANNSLGCENSNVVKEACMMTTSTEELPDLSLEVFPNPSDQGFVSVRLEVPMTRGHLEIFNAQGQSVYTQIFGLTQNLEIPLPDAVGIYWLQVRDEQISVTNWHKLLVI